MNTFSLSHLADHAVTSGLASTTAQDRTTTARLLAYLAEADARRLYVSLGYASMYLYCVHEVHMSEDVALKRIRGARIARKFPAIFDAISDGRLGLSVVLLLGPHLAAESAGELLAAAAHQSNAEIELLLAERFPQPDVPTLVQGMAEATRAASPSHSGLAVRPLQNETRASGRGLEPDAPRPKLAPLSPGRFAVQVTLNQDEYRDLRRAQELLGHVLPSGDAARVIGRALRVLVATLEKRKFAQTDAPRPRRGSAKGRTIPAHVRRVVAERDGGRCTFVGTNGRRCGSTKLLKFDHVVPVARGGEATVDGVRLRCRAHNQYEAEQLFGEGFMRTKREEARQGREQAGAAAASAATAIAAERASEQEVTPWLRALGLNQTEAKRGAALYAHIPGASIEERVRAALRGLAPSCGHRVMPVATTDALLRT